MGKDKELKFLRTFFWHLRECQMKEVVCYKRRLFTCKHWNGILHQERWQTSVEIHNC